MDWKQVVASVAPMLGTAVAGPLGGLAGAALGAIAKALGATEATVQAVEKAVLGATPEQLVALKRADQDFALRLRELGIQEVRDLEQLAVQDRDSARRREIEVRDRTPAVLAALVMLNFALALWWLLEHGPPPDDNTGVVYMMLGGLVGAVVQVLAYYFGSTVGSAAKTQIMAETIAARQPPK